MPVDSRSPQPGVRHGSVPLVADRVSTAVRFGGGVRPLSGRPALARRVRVPVLPEPPQLGPQDEAGQLRVRQLRAPDLGDRGHYPPCQQAAADRVVSGGLLHGDPQQWPVGAPVAVAARPRLVPHGLDARRQAAASGHGGAGPWWRRTAAQWRAWSRSTKPAGRGAPRTILQRVGSDAATTARGWSSVPSR